MSRWVDAEWLMKYFKRGKEYKGEYVLDDLKYDAPSIDIVRCKECKHWKQIIGMIGECESDYMWSTLAGEITEVNSIDRNADDFCSYGERDGE